MTLCDVYCVLFLKFLSDDVFDILLGEGALRSYGSWTKVPVQAGVLFERRNKNGVTKGAVAVSTVVFYLYWYLYLNAATIG